MLTSYRCTFVLLLATLCVSCGCGNASSPVTENFSVVVFSDFHFNPFDDSTLCPALNAADVSAWQGIFEGSSKVATLPPWQHDTNYHLLVVALSGVKQNLGTSPVIIFTGDLLGHSFSSLFSTDCSNPDPVAMKAFANKTAIFVMQQVRASVGDIPVMFVVGNSDSYIGLGPDSTFLAATVGPYYTNFVNGSPANYPAFFNTFTGGGYYSAEPLGPNLKVIALNTNSFAPPYPGFPNTDSAVYAELGWLDTTLALAQANGQKVWLLMHIPPAKYPDVITLTLAAHTHRDEFRIMSPNHVLQITPSISPFFGNDPAFKVLTISQSTFIPIDYRSVNYDLATAPAQFNDYYTYSTAYAAQGPLDDSLTKLYPTLKTDTTKRALYTGHYNSGNNSANFNPITPANWPVFACGIEKMAQQDVIKASCGN